MPELLPISIWPVAQKTSPSQRRGRYLPASDAHPGKMLPAIARRAIQAYTCPGDIVCDPMCGIGTTLVEAIHLGRDAVGIEYEPRWAEIAIANVAFAKSNGATGSAEVLVGDGRHLSSSADPTIRGLVALVLTSPPYGPSVHGHVRTTPGGGVEKLNDSYSRDPANLAAVGLDRLQQAVLEILIGCERLLRPGGIVAMTVRPWRRRGALVDLPGEIGSLASKAGLDLFERNVALLAGLRDERLVPRASFFMLDHARKSRERGAFPRLVIAHEDVLVFRKPLATPYRRGSGGTALARTVESGGSQHGGAESTSLLKYRLDFPPDPEASWGGYDCPVPCSDDSAAPLSGGPHE